MNSLEQQILSFGLQLLSNPSLWQSLMNAGCHNAYDVAQDALEAAEHGHITREQALQICQILLGDRGAGRQPTRAAAPQPQPLPSFDPSLPQMLEHLVR